MATIEVEKIVIRDGTIDTGHFFHTSPTTMAKTEIIYPKNVGIYVAMAFT